MDPDDDKEFEWLTDIENEGDISWTSINPASPLDIVNIKIDLDESIYSDISYGISPVDTAPAVYTSYEQREKHEKYPALKKAWEDYLNMFTLTEGEPPNVNK